MAWDLWKLAKKLEKAFADFEGDYSYFEEQQQTFRRKEYLWMYRDVTSPFASLGALYVLGGDSRGWSQVERHTRAGLLCALEEIQRHDQRLEERGSLDSNSRMCSVEGRHHAIAYLGAIAFNNVRGASLWAERMISEVNSGDSQILQPQYFDEPDVLGPFVLALHCRAFGGTVQFDWKPRKKPRQWAIFENVIDHLDAPAGEFAKAVRPLCDFHIQNCSQAYGKNSFEDPDEQVVPYEALALRRLREIKGLDFPEIDHPLLKGNPLATIPEARERFEGDDLEVAYLKYARAKFPTFPLPFEKEPKSGPPSRVRTLFEDRPPLPKPGKGSKAATAEKSAAVPQAQSAHKPVVTGRVQKNAKFPADVCRLVLKQLGYSDKQCRETFGGDEQIDAESFSSLISESKFGVIADWRGSIADLLASVEEIAKRLKVKMEADEEDEDSATVTFKEGRKATSVAVNYSPNGEGSLHDVAGTLQAASGKRLLFLPLRDSLASDTYCYAVVSPDKLAKFGRPSERTSRRSSPSSSSR